MRSIGVRRAAAGAALLLAIGAVSVSAVLFTARDDSPSTTTSTSPSSTTSSTASTSPPPAPTAVPPACDGPTGGLEGAVISATNRDRAAGGLGDLCSNAQLAGIAQRWTKSIAQRTSLSHQNLDAVLAGLQFATLGENLLDGPGSMSAAEMERAWIASPPHRENILSGAYRAVGVGVATSADGRIWVVVDFGG